LSRETQRRGRLAFYVYIVLGVSAVVMSFAALLWSIGYMERAMVSTSLISAFIGFTLLSAGLYLLRLSAYVYAVEKGEKRGEA